MEHNAIQILLISLNYESAEIKTAKLAHLSDQEWREVVDLAQTHNVAPLLYHRLQQTNIDLPGDLVEKLKQIQRKTTLHNMRLYRVMSKLLHLFHEKGIPVIALKGVYLAEVIYEKIGLRSMRDIDLLVKKEDLLRVEKELLAFGFIPLESNRIITHINHHYGYTLSNGKIRVEIHWEIFPQNYSFQIEIEDLWSRMHPTMLAHAPINVFSPEDLLVHLCLHTIHHTYEMRVVYEMRLRMLCDLGEVVRYFGKGLDWQAVKRLAQQFHGVRAVYVVMRLAQEFLEVAVPSEFLNALRPNDFLDSYFTLACNQIFGAAYESDKSIQWNPNNFARFIAKKGFRNKLELIYRILFKSPKIMALKYPAPANSWRIYTYYPVRWVELLGKYGTSLWHLAFGDPKTRSLAEMRNEVLELHDWLMSG